MLCVIVDPDPESSLIPEMPLTIQDEAHLETLLMQVLRSGPATPMTDTDWDDIRREVQIRAACR